MMKKRHASERTHPHVSDLFDKNITNAVIPHQLHPNVGLSNGSAFGDPLPSPQKTAKPRVRAKSSPDSGRQVWGKTS